MFKILIEALTQYEEITVKEEKPHDIDGPNFDLHFDREKNNTIILKIK